MKSKKGQTMGLAIISAVMLFIVGMLMLNLITPEITRARGSTQMDCTNTSISDGAKITCLVVDSAVPYYFITIFSIVGGIITARMFF
jgi:hypothetical protein|tara:strand:- start:180 stop:440 length:261 start_codon:yes stop_codon:yes gene_type:complete